MAQASSSNVESTLNETTCGTHCTLYDAWVPRTNAPLALAPNAAIRERLGFIHQQLDTFGPQELILGKYTVLGPNNRESGGQGVVQYVMRVHMDGASFYAIKFFATKEEYHYELGLYGNILLRQFMPGVDANSTNEDGSFTDKFGNSLPPFIVMEKGTSLKSLLWSTGNIFTALQVIGHVSERIAQLHRCGYVHRDLKPGNILWQESNRCWVLIDFGHAAKVGSKAPAAMTPSYAAPEAINAYKAGKLVEVHPSLDSWSLGVVVFEILTHCSPAISTSEAMEKVGNSRLQLPWEGSQLSASKREKLGHFLQPLHSLLQRNSKLRATPVAFVRACESLLIPKDEGTGAGTKKAPWYTRFTIKGKTRTRRVDGQVVRRGLPKHAGSINDVAWSRNGGLLVTASEKRNVVLWEAESRKVLGSLTSFSGPVLAVSFSPDSGTLATLTREDGVTLWSVRTLEKIHHYLRQGSSTTLAHAWSPDGATLAAGCSDGVVRLWRSSAWTQPPRELTGHSEGVTCVAWSPDGATLATASSDALALLWSVATGAVTQMLVGRGFALTGVAWRPDGSAVVTTGYDRVALVWDVATGCVKYMLDAHEDWVRGAAWSPDGASIATHSQDGSVIVWDVATGELSHKLKGHSDAVVGVAWNPDGASVASVSRDRTVIVWNVVNGRVAFRLQSEAGMLNCAAWDPEGVVLAAGAASCPLLWDFPWVRASLSRSLTLS